MNISDLLNFLGTLLTGFIGGSIVAIVNYFLTRRKTEAETKKLEAETEKIRAETKKMLDGIQEGLSASVDYKLSDSSEIVIYDSSKNCDPFDFEGKPGRLWSDAAKGPVGETGQGVFSIEKGSILNVRRTNTAGRFELWLRRYMYDGTKRECLPKNELIAGARKLRVSCETKVVDAEHTLEIVVKDADTGQAKSNRVRITRNEWAHIDSYFQVSPSSNYFLRIDDRDVSRAPSSVQIRNVIFAERAA